MRRTAITGVITTVLLLGGCASSLHPGHPQRQPKPIFHVTETYQKGIALARSGRLGEARAMLKAADEERAHSPKPLELETPGAYVRLPDGLTADAARHMLLGAMVASEAASALNPAPHGPGSQGYVLR